MRVKLGGTWITGDSMRERPRDLRINGARVVQDAQFLRASAGRSFDRSNLKTSVSFAISREHSSIQAAEAFILAHYCELPGSGTLELHAEATTGGVKQYYMTNAVLSVTGGSVNGVSTDHSYEITGGILTTTRPT